MWRLKLAVFSVIWLRCDCVACEIVHLKCLNIILVYETPIPASTPFVKTAVDLMLYQNERNTESQTGMPIPEKIITCNEKSENSLSSCKRGERTCTKWPSDCSFDAFLFKIALAF